MKAQDSSFSLSPLLSPKAQEVIHRLFKDLYERHNGYIAYTKNDVDFLELEASKQVDAESAKPIPTAPRNKEAWQIHLAAKMEKQNLLKVRNVLVPLLTDPNMDLTSFKIFSLSNEREPVPIETALSYDLPENRGADRNYAGKAVSIDIQFNQEGNSLKSREEYKDILLKIWKACLDANIELGMYDVPSGERPIRVAGQYRSPFTYCSLKPSQQPHGVLLEDHFNALNYKDPLYPLEFTVSDLEKYGIPTESLATMHKNRITYLETHTDFALNGLNNDFMQLQAHTKNASTLASFYKTITQELDRALKLCNSYRSFDKEALLKELKYFYQHSARHPEKTMLNDDHIEEHSLLDRIYTHQRRLLNDLKEADTFEGQKECLSELKDSFSKSHLLTSNMIPTIKKDYHFAHRYFEFHPIATPLQRLLKTYSKTIPSMIEKKPYEMQLLFRRLVILNHQYEQLEREKAEFQHFPMSLKNYILKDVIKVKNHSNTSQQSIELIFKDKHERSQFLETNKELLEGMKIDTSFYFGRGYRVKLSIPKHRKQPWLNELLEQQLAHLSQEATAVHKKDNNQAAEPNEASPQRILKVPMEDLLRVEYFPNHPKKSAAYFFKDRISREAFLKENAELLKETDIDTSFYFGRGYRVILPVEFEAQCNASSSTNIPQRQATATITNSYGFPNRGKFSTRSKIIEREQENGMTLC